MKGYSMSQYDVALIVSIDASTYKDALRSALDLAKGIAQDGENISAVTHYEHDNEGQRVVYLDAVNEES
jgi:hypothetical protein